MSTRSTYHIYDGSEHIASAYHHHDGYPTGQIHNVLHAIAHLGATTGAGIVQAMEALNDLEICKFDFAWRNDWADEEYNYTLDASEGRVSMKQGDWRAGEGDDFSASYEGFVAEFPPDAWVLQNWEQFVADYRPKDPAREALRETYAALEADYLGATGRVADLEDLLDRARAEADIFRTDLALIFSRLQD
jgi:hypothetical protein